MTLAETNLWIFVATVCFYFLLWNLLDGRYEPERLLKRGALLFLLCAPFEINGYVFTIIGNAKSEKSVYSVSSLYQGAGKDAVTIVGLSGYQKAGQHTLTLVGLSGYQKAGENAVVGFGLSGYQKAGKDAVTIVGLSGYQEARENAVVELGLSGYQEGEQSTQVTIGVSLYQKVQGKERAFGAFTKLKNE